MSFTTRYYFLCLIIYIIEYFSYSGECVCKSGFHGPDCGIKEDELIKIDDIEGGEVCDVLYGEDCRCFHIQTINLLENFHCKMSEISVRYILNSVICSFLQNKKLQCIYFTFLKLNYRSW